MEGEQAMIGGYDIVFDSQAEPEDVLKKVWLLISSLWPDAVVEDGNTGELLSVTFPLDIFADRDEILIYQDANALDDWTKEGGEPANLGKMIHVLATKGEATLVVDDPSQFIAKQLIQS